MSALIPPEALLELPFHDMPWLFWLYLLLVGDLEDLGEAQAHALPHARIPAPQLTVQMRHNFRQDVVTQLLDQIAQGPPGHGALV